MISDKVQAAFNDQIREETFSAYLYLSMVAYFESINLGGFANWMRAQTQEEMLHAMKFFDFIADRGGRVELQALEQPQVEWDSPLAAFEAAYKHEQHISGRIGMLMKLAREENDFAAMAFLEWFVTEQVEEEKNADGMVQSLRMAGDRGPGLLMLDREAGGRVFTATEATAE